MKLKETTIFKDGRESSSNEIELSDVHKFDRALAKIGWSRQQRLKFRREKRVVIEYDDATTTIEIHK